MNEGLETKELFFTADYSLNNQGGVTKKFQNYLGDLFKAIEADGEHLVYCPVREAGWKVRDMEPSEAFAADMEAIERSVGVIALIQNRESPQVYPEIGYGVACNKIPVLAYAPGVKIGKVHPPLEVFSGTLRKAVASDPAELAHRIRRYL